jgi:hypothetical protein
MGCWLLLQVAGKSWTQCEWAQVQSGFDSLLRDEICTERPARNVNQHASGTVCPGEVMPSSLTIPLAVFRLSPANRKISSFS